MNNFEQYSGTVEALSGSIRLDRYVAETLGLINRSQIKSRLLEGKLNGKIVKLSRLVKNGDTIELSWRPVLPVCLEPENIPLDIIYEDKHCAVINKSQGMVVHPGAGNHSGTLANALLWRRQNYLEEPAVCRNFADETQYRSGIVHRLDKETSGVIITAYDTETLEFLSAQFRTRTVRKSYLALVQGVPAESSGSILTRLIRDPKDRKCFTAIPSSKAVPVSGNSGKTALTRFVVLKTWGDYSLLLLRPRTGRTHQLRVHLKYLGHPILGDTLYNPQYNPKGKNRNKNQIKTLCDLSLMLHAWQLALVLPGEADRRNFKAPLPEHFSAAIAALNRLYQ